MPDIQTMQKFGKNFCFEKFKLFNTFKISDKDLLKNQITFLNQIFLTLPLDTLQPITALFLSRINSVCPKNH